MFTDRKRLNRLCAYFLKEGKIRPERRGGERIKESKQLATDSIKKFLSDLQPTESHYGRGKSCRYYLSPLLNVRRLWLMWSKTYKNENPNGDTITYEHFHRIFSSDFNMAFGSPRTDVCSTCVEFESKIKAGGDIAENAALELKLHKLESKHFTRIYNQETEDSSTFTACFDMQQNFPLPRTNIGEVFYKRQLWMYNLGIVCTKFSKKYNNVHLYTWLESQTGKGGNEVVSILIDFLTNLSNNSAFKRKNYKTLSLFSDSCPAQNKNYSMVLALLMFVNSPQCPFLKITFTFPVRGHSYMAPDRVFGRIEKELKKHETLLLPSHYSAVLENHGEVHPYGTSWKPYNYKVLSDTSLKKNTLPIQKSKRWMFKKRFRSIWSATDYTSDLKCYNIVKKDLRLASLKAPLVPTKSHVSAAKKKDVEEIVQLLNVDESVKSFYDEALKN